MKKLIPLSVAFISLVLVLSGCSTPDAVSSPATTATPAVAAADGSPLSANETLVSQYVARLISIPSKDFTLKDLKGKEWKLSDLKGKIVLLNFWATWCGPCQMEMPGFQKLYEQFGDSGEVVVLTIASVANEGLSEKESRDTVAQFIDSQKYTFSVPFDTDGSVWKIYQQKGIPANYILDKQGNVRLLVVGAFANEDAMYAALEAVRRQDAE